MPTKEPSSSSSTPRKGSRPIGAGPAAGPNRRILWLAAGLAVALLLILAGAALLNTRSAPTEPATTSGGYSERYGQPVAGRKIGSPDAPVEIIAYEDFQCSHCQRFNQEVKSSIMSDLVAPGLASFEFRHRFVIGPDSVRAGAATECAADQGRFWEYHDALFDALTANPRAVNSGDFKNLASQIGLDTVAFNACVDSDTHIEKMLREDSEARNAGVNATPTILINGQRYENAFTPEAFKAAVEAAAGQQ